MKLAEALNARKELEARLTRLEERLHASARVQEGLEPDESPDALYAMLEKAAAELVEIVSRISRTNVETVVEGRILADWIAERDVSWRRLRVLQSALRAAAPSYDRHGGGLAGEVEGVAVQVGDDLQHRPPPCRARRACASHQRDRRPHPAGELGDRVALTIMPSGEAS